jgi:hypothetical protein
LPAAEKIKFLAGGERMKNGPWQTWPGMILAAIAWLVLAKTTIDFIRIFQFGGLGTYAGRVSLGFMLWDGLIAAIFSVGTLFLVRRTLSKERFRTLAGIMIATAIGFGMVGALLSYEQPTLRIRLPGP